MYPQIPQRRNSQTPKVLLALLASMALNKRLRQGGMNQPMVRSAIPGQQRMADLAQMSLNMGGRRPPMGY